MEKSIISIRKKARDHRMKRLKVRLLPADNLVFIKVVLCLSIYKILKKTCKDWQFTYWHTVRAFFYRAFLID